MRKYIITLASLVLVLTALAPAFANSSEKPSPPESMTLKSESGEPVPAGLMQAVQQAQHAIEVDGEAQFKAYNSANRQRIQFNDESVQIMPAGNSSDWQWGLKLTGYGTVSDIAPVADATRTVNGQRIEFQRGPMTEWYENRFIGLEQGFTLTEPPVADTDHIVIELAIEGGLEPRWVEEGQSLAFHQADGSYALTYRDLVAFDVDQRDLPACLVLAENTLQIHVDASGASWPIVIDPLVVNEQKVTAQISDGASSDLFGYSLSFSADTALVGAIDDDDNGSRSGSAFVFVRSGDNWTQQAKLLASDGVTTDFFGTSVSLSGDTALIGAYNAEGYNGSAYVFTRSGTTWTEQQELTASDGASSDYFGYSVAVSGDTALIGAFFDDDIAANSGSAYVFTRSGGTWTPQQKLLASDAVASGRFGISVALSGESALIGADGDDDNGTSSGSAYVFTRSDTTWTEQNKLLPTVGAANDYFGHAVALSGETALVGAANHDGASTDSGAAYVFTRSGTSWGQQQKLTASDATFNDHFGWSVSLVGDVTLIGAYKDKPFGTESGSAYVFTRSGTTWTEQQKLIATDGHYGDFFGYSTALSGGTVLIGAPWENTNGPSSGSLYVFNINDYDQWVWQTKLLPVQSDGAVNDYLGHSVALSGDTALVGAYGDDDNGSASGSAYVLTRSGASWQMRAKLTASDGVATDRFGYSVAISGDTALVGAYGDDDIPNDSGSAYVFVKPSGGWATTDEFDAKLTASDGAADDFFGYSVAISGNTALVSSISDDDKGNDSGSAYVFVKPDGGWTTPLTSPTYDAKLTASDGVAQDFFGRSVAISGNTALVGADYDDDEGSNSGSAYVFVKPDGGWTTPLTSPTYDAKLTASDGAVDDRFGYSVALSGDTALVGALLDDDEGTDAGAAYVFVEPGAGWVTTDAFDAKLTASDGLNIDQFGYSVAISGNTALVGAYEGDGNVGNSGSAYVFVRPNGGWATTNIFEVELIASDGEWNEHYGQSVAVSGDTALVGKSSSSGSAYFYTFPCSFGHEIEVGQWAMIAAPCSPTTPGTVTSAFEDDLLMGDYGSQWILYERDESSDAYVALIATDPVDPGVGMWFKSLVPGTGTLDFEGTPTPMVGDPSCPSDNGCFVVDLTAPGAGGDPLFNMVGHPLPYSVDLADLRITRTFLSTTNVYTLSAAESAGLVSKTVSWWNGNSYDAYDDVTPGMEGSLRSLQSIWLRVLNGAVGYELKLLIPATPSIRTGQLDDDKPWYVSVIDWLIPSAQAASDNVKKHQDSHASVNKVGKDKTPAEWYVRLIVEQPTLGLKDSNSVFGQLADSNAGYDSHDLEEKPPFGDTWLTLLFPHPEWGQQSENFASDFHALPTKKSEGDSWLFEVHSDDPGRVLNLSWQGPADILDRSTLIDTQTGTEVPAINGIYQFDMNGQARSFEWVLGREAGSGKGKKK